MSNPETTVGRIDFGPMPDLSVWVPPWQRGILSCWSIVGMNHYFVGGSRRLFVAMMRFDRAIKAEGPDGPELWADLERQADGKSA